ncbi:MAG: HAD family hydrolase [Lachnospiraceae bacterium]|nr:HAD family hydrolase [Lachnospiraceae bacterium]
MKAILFDMDRTLVPMDEEMFIKTYFGGLARKLCPVGVEKDPLIAAIWKATGGMIRNDGNHTNYDIFWNVFAEELKVDAAPFMEASDAFYRQEFYDVKKVTGENPLAAEAIKAAREAADYVVLASQPIFPMAAQLARASFVGLKKEDFDMITAYETECYAKPNPKYYEAICKRLGVEPKDCLMIGNDEKEDMYAASQAGLNCYLVTDHINAREEYPWDGLRGTFKDMIEMLKTLK